MMGPFSPVRKLAEWLRTQKLECFCWWRDNALHPCHNYRDQEEIHTAAIGSWCIPGGRDYSKWYPGGAV